MDSQELRQIIKEEISPLHKEISGLKSEMDARFTRVDEKFAGMDERIADMDEKFAGMDAKIEGIKVLIENDICPSIRKIAEGHAMLAEKLERIDHIEDRLDEMQGSMAALEAAIIKNSTSIREIKKAQG